MTTITPALEHSWKNSLQSGNTLRMRMIGMNIFLMKTTTTKTTTMTTKTTITPVLEHSWKKSLQSGNTSRRMMMRVKIVFSEDNDN